MFIPVWALVVIAIALWWYISTQASKYSSESCEKRSRN